MGLISAVSVRLKLGDPRLLSDFTAAPAPRGPGVDLSVLSGNDSGVGDCTVSPIPAWVEWAALILKCRGAGLAVLHGLIFAGLFVTAYLIHFDGAIPAEQMSRAWALLPAAVLLKPLIFFAMGSHRGWWRYTSFADMTTIAGASVLSTLVLFAVDALLPPILRTSRSVLLLDGGGTLLVLGGVRGTIRLLRERFRPMIVGPRRERTVVVGADEFGMAIARQIQRQPSLGMTIAGFLDDDRRTHGRTLGGVRVIGGTGDVARLAARHHVQTVLIPTPTVHPRTVPAVVAECKAAQLNAKIVPRFDALLSGALTGQPRNVEIQDLLARDPVRLDEAAVARLIRGRSVMVTGAAGSIGSEICRLALSYAPERLVLLDHSENGLFFLENEIRGVARGTEVVPSVGSITDRVRLRSVFDRFRPQVVFHAAAHKHVPLMEMNPGEAVKNNVFGTRNLADECVRSGVETFVLISTDKAVNPTSVMGACKRLCEMYCLALACTSDTRLVTVRFGNVLGSAGSVVPVFREQIRRGGPVTVTHPEATRYFMTIPEAVRLVLQAGAMGNGGEVFVLDMGEPIRIVDLAREMIRLSNLTVGEHVEIVYTGLRPGEKLHEELQDRSEQRIPTIHPKVFLIGPSASPGGQGVPDLGRLEQTLEAAERDVIEALAELVPGYRPPIAPVPSSQFTDLPYLSKLRTDGSTRGTVMRG